MLDREGQQRVNFVFQVQVQAQAQQIGSAAVPSVALPPTVAAAKLQAHALSKPVYHDR